MATAPWPGQGTVAEDDPPLTSPWHVPESCTWTYNAANTAEAVAWLDLKPIPSETTLSCYPSGMFDGDNWGVFSPAACPRGWTTVNVEVDTDRPPAEATTTATCCSSGYTYENGYCGRKNIPYVLAVPMTTVTGGASPTYSIQTESTTTLYDATIAVHTIRAMWQQADQAVFGITGGEHMDDGSGEASGGLSVDAKAGIGVGVGVGVLMIAALIFLLMRRRTRGSRSRCGHEMAMPYPGRCTLSPTSAERHRRGATPDPPPSYDDAAGTDVSSLESGSGPECRHVVAAPAAAAAAAAAALAGPRRSHHEAEILVLREQKEAIQKRIEELESGHGRIPSHNGRTAR